MRRAFLVGVVLSGAVTVSGCALFSHPPTERTVANAAPAGCPSADVLASGTSYLTVGLLPPDIEPVAVVRCPLPQLSGAGAPPETASVADNPDLLAALRLADVPTPYGQSCDASMELLPWMAVVLADGTWLPVGWAVNECGKPRAVPAMEAATWSTPPSS